MNIINVNFFRNISFIIALVLMTNLANAQVAMNNDIAVTDLSSYTEAEVEETPTTFTNLKEVGVEISQYLQSNLELPEYLIEIYNTNVELLVAMSITKEGTIENIHVDGGEGNQWLEKQVKKELETLKNVTPVTEGTEFVAKDIIIPVIFDFDLD